jgi:hypothetical protein
MRARRAGSGSEFRLLQDEMEVGRVDGTTVRFLGFATREDAALAASAAHHALARRRGEQRPGESDDAVITVDDESGSETGGWGFEIPLLSSERPEVFALGRARVIWRALQGTGIARRMRQFADGHAPI